MSAILAPMGWNEVQTVFWRARELPEPERERFLLSACGDDHELLAEVRRMLAADERQGILDRAPVASDAPTEPTVTLSSDRVGPYVLTDEIGRGAMGVVYRAYDPRLRREVALKFLPAASHGDSRAKARFIDEARAASALDHPHTCPVYDIGTAEDGRLYIAMAYCGGGSLAQRLAGGALPVDVAVRVASEVGEALDAAHEAGIVHRDVKPANIAFTERGEARVLDFGIAILGQHEWASPRISAGTPAYMAPEQIRGEAVDRRTDVWALGIVLHEMLTGQRPFTGADRKALADAILGAAPNDVRAVRPEAPPPLVEIIARALEKDPARRFATAAEMVAALRGVAVSMAGGAADVSSAARSGDALRAPIGRAWSRRRAVYLGLAGLVIAGGGTAILSRGDDATATNAPFDPAAVAVVPFRVSGNESLGYLREGMVDLLAAKLTGEGGLRAADPRTVLRAWRQTAEGEDADLTSEVARSLARRLGAGKVLLGNVVGTPSAIVVNATVLDAGGAVVSRASAQGAHTDLSALVDRLIAQLLTLSAGEEPQRLAALTSTSLPALKAYLEGQAAYRRGNFAEALEKYGRALDFDSTFALAGLGLALADGWVGTMHARARGVAAAWRWQERLNERDRAFLHAVIGPAYPRTPTAREQIDATERALRLTPDRVELWYELGDQYFHYGRVLGAEDWERQAERGLRRAVELDSGFAAAVHHLVAMYARQGRTAELRALASAELARTPSGPAADYIRWRRALALGEASASSTARLDSLATETLGWIGMNAHDDGAGVAVGTHAVMVRSERPGTREEQLERRLSVHAAMLNHGRPGEALAAIATIRDLQPDPGFVLRLQVLDALYGDGDRAAAERAVDALRGRRAADAPERRLDRCVLELWRLETWRSATEGAEAGSPNVGNDRPAGRDSTQQLICGATVEAMRAVARGDASAAEWIGRLDALLRTSPIEFYPGDGISDFAQIVLTRLLEASGDTAGALSAIRRRPYFIGWQPYLAASLLHEARLATAVGDTTGAVRAYEHYLALRSEPEPPLRAAADSARAELARIR